MNDSVGVACLPEAGEILTHGTPCFISGWGNLYSNVLLCQPAFALIAADHSRGSVCAQNKLVIRCRQMQMPVCEVLSNVAALITNM